jgi:hypothetical protein
MSVPFDEKDSRVKTDARAALVVAHEKDVYQRAFATAKSTLRGRFAIFARQVFGLPPISDRDVKMQMRLERLAALSKDVLHSFGYTSEGVKLATSVVAYEKNAAQRAEEERDKFNRPTLERQWPGKKIMATPFPVSPIDDDSGCRCDSCYQPCDNYSDPPLLDNELDLGQQAQKKVSKPDGVFNKKRAKKTVKKSKAKKPAAKRKK